MEGRGQKKWKKKKWWMVTSQSQKPGCDIIYDPQAAADAFKREVVSSCGWTASGVVVDTRRAGRAATANQRTWTRCERTTRRPMMRLLTPADDN